jgi:hypothetical protein
MMPRGSLSKPPRERQRSGSGSGLEANTRLSFVHCACAPGA